jgi:4-nitrophenyl phosphatase
VAKTIVFDLDGVVYRGAQGIPGVSAEVARLQKKTKVLFLTNNATKSRLDYVEHLARFGISVKPNDVMTSSFGAAHYLREKHGKGRKVFVIGEQGLTDELEEEAEARLVKGDRGAEFVVVGLDRKIDYEKLEKAVRQLRSGASLIVANTDPSYPTESGISPGSGAIASAIIYASGVKPEFIAGKPSTYLVEKLLAMHKVKPHDSVFVGDRLDIDIRMANKIGMDSILVLTGIADKEDALRAPDSDKPRKIIPSAADVGRVIGV